ncbi:MAG TPA: hypothetical protein VH590_12850, partial [Ktedonobacterales bacterium]
MSTLALSVTENLFRMIGKWLFPAGKQIWDFTAILLPIAEVSLLMFQKRSYAPGTETCKLLNPASIS